MAEHTAVGDGASDNTADDDLQARFDVVPGTGQQPATVRAAISSARPVLSPRRSALSLMCSYCRSRFGLDPLGMSAAFRRRRSLDRARTRHGWRLYPGRPGPFSCPGVSERL